MDSTDATPSLHLDPSTGALTLLPAIHALSFSHSPTLKSWASHLLTHLEPPQGALSPVQDPSVNPNSAPDPSSNHAPSSLPDSANRLLCTLWCAGGVAGALSALGWLRSLSCLLAESRAADLESQGSGISDGAGGRRLSPAVVAVLAGLLAHPTPAVRAAAAATCADAAMAFPLLGMTFLPVLVFHARRAIASVSGGEFVRCTTSGFVEF